jgi:hypothetical protein
MTALTPTTFATLRDIPAELCAGVLVTTSVPDRPIDGEYLRALLKQRGLDDSLVPESKKISEVHAFQNACRSVETRRGASAKGKRTTVAVGEVVTNGAESVYQITAEVRDEVNRVIEHPKAMRIVYDKAFAGPGNDPIHVEELDPNYAQALKPLADQIQLRFDALRGRLQGAKVREILRAQFRTMFAPRWANATYFVDLAHVDKLEAMSEVIAALYKGDAKYATAPVFNTASVRSNLKVAIGEHVTDDVTQLMAAFAKKLSAKDEHGQPKKLTDREFEHANDQRAALVRQAEAMMANYGEEIATVREALGLVNEQVMALWERAQ